MRFMGDRLAEIHSLLAANARVGRPPSPAPAAPRSDLFARPIRAALTPDEKRVRASIQKYHDEVYSKDFFQIFNAERETPGRS